MNDEIQVVAIEKINEVISSRRPLGLFLSRGHRVGGKKGSFIAVDNSTGNAWTEEFKNLSDAEEWLTRR